MLWALLACTTPPVAPVPPPLPAHQVFPSAEEALRSLTASKPKILGIGEVHATEGGPKGPTTLDRFRTRLLPVLAPDYTDLVLETWRLDGTCAPASEVSAKVREDTHRPVETKSELARLVEDAAALGVRPHDLAITCDEYAGLTGEDGAVSYDRLLRLLGGKLGEYAERGVATEDARLVLYGGAVHNDRAPSEAVAPYSYGAAAAARGGYVELDLYAPELVRGNEALVEPSWAPLLGITGPDRAILFERQPGSFVLLLEEADPPR
jgi:hypothetical protein